MKKIIVALCSVLFVTSFSFGFEWGGNFINDTAFVGHDVKKSTFVQSKNTLNLSSCTSNC